MKAFKKLMAVITAMMVMVPCIYFSVFAEETAVTESESPVVENVDATGGDGDIAVNEEINV